MMCDKTKETNGVADNDTKPPVLDKNGNPIKRGDKILFDDMEFLVDCGIW